MWSRSLALTLLLLPAPALAGVKEKVAALAPPGLVLVMDAEDNEWWLRTLMSPSSRPQSPRS
jgi:serine-type D-Ala-D-Ala carboxypeptidase/endopeptidase (penicillin-binding protein 4)